MFADVGLIQVAKETDILNSSICDVQNNQTGANSKNSITVINHLKANETIENAKTFEPLESKAVVHPNDIDGQLEVLKSLQAPNKDGDLRSLTKSELNLDTEAQSSISSLIIHKVSISNAIFCMSQKGKSFFRWYFWAFFASY